MKSKVEINRLSTGVPGLDEILGGGLPEFSLNLIAVQRVRQDNSGPSVDVFYGNQGAAGFVLHRSR